MDWKLTSWCARRILILLCMAIRYVYGSRLISRAKRKQGTITTVLANDRRNLLAGERLRIGNCDDCDLRLRASALPKRPDSNGLVLELAGTNGSYSVVEVDPGLTLSLNGQPLEKDVLIKDGDELRIADSILSLQFFPLRSLPAVVPRRRGKLLSHLSSKPRRSNLPPLLAVMMQKYSCANSRVNSFVKLISVQN